MNVVKQRDLKDCGACSLLSIIMHYGGFVPLEKIRLDTHTDMSGTTAYHLVASAKKYGFNSYGAKVEEDSLFKGEVILPAIAHLILDNGLEHFVVIYKVSKTKVTIMDPAKGKVIMNKKDFLHLWTKILILFHPQQKILKYNKDKKLSDLLFSILKVEKSLILKLVYTSICLTALAIISSYYFKVGLTAITNNHYINTLLYIIILFAIITLFKVLFEHIRNYFENHLNKNIDIRLFSDFITHLFNLPLNIVKNRSSGEIFTRVSELNDLKILFTEFFVTVFLDSILAITSMILLYMISKELFFILCIAILFYLLLGIIFNSINYRKIMQNIELETDFNTTLIENVDMFESIKNLNTTTLNVEKIENNLVKFLKSNFNISNFFNRQTTIKNFISEFSLFLVNTVGFYLIKTNSLAVVDLITFNSLMSFYLEPIRNTIDMLPKINYLKASYYKLNDFLGNKPEDITKEPEKFLNNDIVIKNLSYSYNDYNYILNNINLNIKENEHVFLKGNSGSGKSTICKLIYRLIERTKGNILIGGVSISDYSLSSIRNNITYVSQDENIFTSTIRENIVYNRDIELSEFNKVCEICELESVVAKRPLRYESLISNDTSNLSGGEKQRVILARALLKKSKILLLDEALSEVDYDLEAKIINNIKEAYQDKTIVFVSHKNHEKLFNRVVNLENKNERI